MKFKSKSSAIVALAVSLVAITSAYAIPTHLMSITYFSEPEKITPVGSSTRLCNGATKDFGVITPYMEIDMTECPRNPKKCDPSDTSRICR